MACAVSIRIVVDLPAPLGPSRPTHVPAGTSRSRPSTAVIAPKRFTTPRSRMAGSLTSPQVSRPPPAGAGAIRTAPLSSGAHGSPVHLPDAPPDEGVPA